MTRNARYGEPAKQRSFRLTSKAEKGLKEIAAIGKVNVSELLNRLGHGDEEVLMWLAKWLARRDDKTDKV